MSEHNFIYDPHCSRCGADGSEVDTECPGDTILAAAHRAGAREACAKLSEWALDAMEGEGSGAFTAYENCHVSAENLKRHYAEPEEEKLKENPHLTEEHCEKLKKEFGMEREVYRRYFLGEWDVPPEPEEEKKG